MWKFNVEALKMVREEKNMTMREASKGLGVTFQAIHNWESGKAVPSLKNMLKLCHEYGLKPSAFFKEV